MKYFNQFFLLSIFFICLTTQSKAQSYYNNDVEGKIEVANNQEFITLTGTAYNKTQFIQTLRYELSVFKTDIEGNINKNTQSGSFVLSENEKKTLSTTTLNANNKTKIIVLLLIYDLDDMLVGKGRIAFNDTSELKTEIIEKPKNEFGNTDENRSRANNNDGTFILKGVVVEDTKTKFGRDFYKKFYSYYSTNNINGERIVEIKEIFALGTNTKIEVKVEDDVVLSFFVNPKPEFLDIYAKEAVRRVYRKFQELKTQKEIVKRY